MELSRKLCAWSCCAAMLVGPLACAAGEVPGMQRDAGAPTDARETSRNSSPVTMAPLGGHEGQGMAGAKRLGEPMPRVAPAESESADAHFRQAEVLTRAGSLDAALSTYTLAIALSPDHEGALRGRWRLCVRLSLHRQALKDLTRLIELRPGKAEYRYERGRTHLKLHSVREAFRDFQKAHELDRRYPRPTLIEDSGRVDRALIARGDWSRKDRCTFARAECGAPVSNFRRDGADA